MVLFMNKFKNMIKFINNAIKMQWQSKKQGNVILLPVFWWQQIGWSYCATSRTWHDAIRIKRSVCHAIGMLLVV